MRLYSTANEIHANTHKLEQWVMGSIHSPTHNPSTSFCHSWSVRPRCLPLSTFNTEQHSATQWGQTVFNYNW